MHLLNVLIGVPSVGALGTLVLSALFGIISFGAFAEVLLHIGGLVGRFSVDALSGTLSFDVPLSMALVHALSGTLSFDALLGKFSVGAPLMVLVLLTRPWRCSTRS